MLKDRANMTSTVLYAPIPENEVRKTLNRSHYDCWHRGLAAYAADSDIKLPIPGSDAATEPVKENTA
jgi:hypothetical protein